MIGRLAGRAGCRESPGPCDQGPWANREFGRAEKWAVAKGKLRIDGATPNIGSRTPSAERRRRRQLVEIAEQDGRHARQFEERVEKRAGLIHPWKDEAAPGEPR